MPTPGGCHHICHMHLIFSWQVEVPSSGRRSYFPIPCNYSGDWNDSKPPRKWVCSRPKVKDRLGVVPTPLPPKELTGVESNVVAREGVS